ncbi:hypothetical protein BDQ12DRAFT_252578 [Crucibulum laeve]|uniref:Uncharacterized protein n=1 Tax=Crucibulum laeve TaxID=68775 RepID=A0A5C3LVP3_9AGAR|nr:hypothetical protein BDQ12DRAFT_252578 [Crucibulum laeve]
MINKLIPFAINTGFLTRCILTLAQGRVLIDAGVYILLCLCDAAFFDFDFNYHPTYIPTYSLGSTHQASEIFSFYAFFILILHIFVPLFFVFRFFSSHLHDQHSVLSGTQNYFRRCTSSKASSQPPVSMLPPATNPLPPCLTSMLHATSSHFHLPPSMPAASTAQPTSYLELGSF